MKNKLQYEKFCKEQLSMFTGKDDHVLIGFAVYEVDNNISVSRHLEEINEDLALWGCTVLQYNGVIPSLIACERIALSVVACKYPNYILYTMNEEKLREELVQVFAAKFLDDYDSKSFNPFNTLRWLIRQSDRFAPIDFKEISKKVIHSPKVINISTGYPQCE